MRNFDDTARRASAVERAGREFSDSEVYKLLEAMSWEYGRSVTLTWTCASRPSPTGWRLPSRPTVTSTRRSGDTVPPVAGSDLEWGHELYCLGHLFQAGVARARTVRAGPAPGGLHPGR